MTNSQQRLSPDEFARVPIKRAELIEGVVVELPHKMLRQALIITIIGVALHDFIKERRLGQVAAGGSFLTGPNTVRMPSFSFLSHADLEGENTDEIIRKAPTLAVEILLKEDADGAFDDKADEFIAAGSQAVWIVNPRRRTVAVHTPGAAPQMHNIGDTIAGGAVLPGFELPVAAIFED